MIPTPIHVPVLPFYSQFKDISSDTWQKQGCGIASLAMVIQYYQKESVSVDTLLKQGIVLGAYDQKYGWTYKGLIQVANKHGMSGETHDFGNSKTSVAFEALKTELKKGPVIASVHYQFNPKSTIPHLVVIDDIDEDTLYYNDPAAKTGQKHISSADFLKGWKKRYITIRPA